MKVTDTTSQISIPEHLSEKAIAYFQERLFAIANDLSASQHAYRQGLLTKGELSGIHKSLARAKQEVQVALDIVSQRTCGR